MLTFDTFYPSDIHITDQTLLLNIETTGLSPRNAFVFMIGLGWQEEKGWHFQCLLAEKKMDERELMQQWLEHKYPQTQTTRARKPGRSRNGDASRYAGFREGQNVRLHRPVSGQEQQKLEAR